MKINSCQDLFGVTYQIYVISDIYIMINSSRKISYEIESKIFYILSHHNMRNITKRSEYFRMVENYTALDNPVPLPLLISCVLRTSLQE